MSAVPPPPFGTPQRGAPFPAVDRRTRRAQRQAAAAQARWQRDQFRMQTRAARRTSIVGPVLLLSLGVVLLLLTSGRLRWTEALGWLGRWWPLVLIIAGLLMTAEWGLDRYQMTTGGAPTIPRRILGGGTVAILLLLGLVGVGVMIAENGSEWARRNFGQSLADNGFGDWRQAFGVRSEFTQDLHAPLSNHGFLTIDNPRGDVTVSGSSQDGQVHIQVQQHVYAWHQNEIEARHRAEAPVLSGDPAHLTVITPVKDQDDADLTVELPRDAILTIHSGRGDVSVEELRGSTAIEANHGDVRLTALTGAVHLKTADDNATITAHSLGSGFSLEGHSGDISLSDVDGPVLLHGDFFGSTHVERIRGTVTFQSSFTSFACAGIPGELNIEGRSDLDGTQVQGPLTLNTTDRNLTLNDVRGGAVITDRNGSVILTVSGKPQPVQVTNANGSVEVVVPPNQGFAVNAHTDNGEIENDFDLRPEKNGDSSLLRGRIAAGGPPLTLQTSEADITLRRATAEEGPDWAQPSQHLLLQHDKPARGAEEKTSEH